MIENDIRLRNTAYRIGKSNFDGYDDFCKAIHADEEDPELMAQDYEQTTRRGLARDTKRIGRTNPKADSYWDSEPENETG